MIICECSKDGGLGYIGRGNIGIREIGYLFTSKIQKRFSELPVVPSMQRRKFLLTIVA